MTIEDKQALTEVNKILSLMETEYIDKLPNKLMRFIKKNMDNSYICDINIYTPLNQQNLREKTKIFLSLIYRNYWCNEEKKRKLMNRDAYLQSEHEKMIRQIYNPDDIFRDKKHNVSDNSAKSNTTSMIKYKEPLLKRIINKIKNIFN